MTATEFRKFSTALALAAGNDNFRKNPTAMNANCQLPVALSTGRSRTVCNPARILLMGLLLTSAIGTASAQNVYLDNSRTGCEYKVKVYYATGSC